MPNSSFSSSEKVSNKNHSRERHLLSASAQWRALLSPNTGQSFADRSAKEHNGMINPSGLLRETLNHCPSSVKSCSQAINRVIASYWRSCANILIIGVHRARQKVQFCPFTPLYFSFADKAMLKLTISESVGKKACILRFAALNLLWSRITKPIIRGRRQSPSSFILHEEYWLGCALSLVSCSKQFDSQLWRTGLCVWRKKKKPTR